MCVHVTLFMLQGWGSPPGPPQGGSHALAAAGAEPRRRGSAALLPGASPALGQASGGWELAKDRAPGRGNREGTRDPARPSMSSESEQQSPLLSGSSLTLA